MRFRNPRPIRIVSLLCLDTIHVATGLGFLNRIDPWTRKNVGFKPLIMNDVFRRHLTLMQIPGEIPI